MGEKFVGISRKKNPRTTYLRTPSEAHDRSLSMLTFVKSRWSSARPLVSTLNYEQVVVPSSGAQVGMWLTFLFFQSPSTSHTYATIPLESERAVVINVSFKKEPLRCGTECEKCETGTA